MLAVAVTLFPEVLFGQAVPQPPRQDFQAWTAIEATHPVGKNTDFLLSAGLRYGNDQRQLTYRRIAAGFAFHWSRFFTFEPYYQYSVSDAFPKILSHENRLALAATVGAPWKRWEISDRSVLDLRFLQDRRSWRYRNRVEFRRPIGVARKRFSLFAWDEVYYSPIARRWYRNRLALGVGRRLSRKLSIDVFFVQQNDGYSRPGDVNALGTTLKARF